MVSQIWLICKLCEYFVIIIVTFGIRIANLQGGFDLMTMMEQASGFVKQKKMRIGHLSKKIIPDVGPITMSLCKKLNDRHT